MVKRIPICTELEVKRGLIKTNWENARHQIEKVNSVFATLVDELSPNDTFPIYLAYYPYGSIITDTETAYLPTADDKTCSLLDPNAPADINKHLGYGKHSAPFTMLLEKTMEWFIDLKEEQISLPHWGINPPGSIYPLSRLLSKKRKVFSPNGVLSCSAGARSVFMLPHIGSTIKHMNLQRDFKIQSSPPKSLYEHWNIFSEIVSSPLIDCDWRCCLALFSEKWQTSIQNDPAWHKLKMHLLELAWEKTEYERHRFYFDVIFSLIKQKRGLKPNPYLSDTARHLIAIAIGEAAGFSPACNDDSLPLDLIQKAYVESYGLKKYGPTIMQPARFNLENNSLPVYYSMQNPSTTVFSPKSRQLTSTLFEMRELEFLMKVFIDELSGDKSPCADTTLYEMIKKVKFNYFHNEKDSHGTIKSSTKIVALDKRFSEQFASDAKFLRGCISIQAGQ